jgi:hypothetical protein
LKGKEIVIKWGIENGIKMLKMPFQHVLALASNPRFPDFSRAGRMPALGWAGCVGPISEP